MSNTWIGTIRLTNEDGVYGSDGEKIHDLLEIPKVGEVVVFDPTEYHELSIKLESTTLPSIDPPEGPPFPYKIIADKT